jgi:hypothetical protein
VRRLGSLAADVAAFHGQVFEQVNRVQWAVLSREAGAEEGVRLRDYFMVVRGQLRDVGCRIASAVEQVDRCIPSH